MKRTIKYYYELDEEKSSQLVRDVLAGTQRSPSTVYMWLRGERKPCFLEKQFIAKAVKKIYGEKVTIKELFA